MRFRVDTPRSSALPLPPPCLRSVDALVDGLKAFRGGVLLVSHDQRLVKGLDCELWVCGDGNDDDATATGKPGQGNGGGNGRGGVRVERRGFDHYRQALVRVIEARAAALEAAAAERAAVRKALRAERIARLKSGKARATGKAGRAAPGNAAAASAEKQRNVAMAAMFDKKKKKKVK